MSGLEANRLDVAAAMSEEVSMAFFIGECVVNGLLMSS